MIVFIVIILAMIGVFSLRLYKTQAAVTEESLVTADADSMTYQSTVEAARGNILDRNGNVLVSNRASYNLVIVNFVFFNAPDPNGNLLKVLDLCDELGIQYESHFPVTPDRPYEYTDDNNSAWQENFRKFLADRGYDLDISAPTLMKRLRSEYKIPDDWKQADVYRIIAVRYELELRSDRGRRPGKLHAGGGRRRGIPRRRHGAGRAGRRGRKRHGAANITRSTPRTFSATSVQFGARKPMNTVKRATP